MKIILALLVTGFTCTAQIGIGTTDPKATLDIRSSNPSAPSATEGMLVPKILNFPASNPTTVGILVYLEDTDNNNTEADGFYYWNGSSWTPLSNWRMDGNTGTTASTSAIGVAANNNYMGTDDNVALVLATNSLERMRITQDGKIGIGINNPSKKLEIDAGNDLLKISNLSTVPLTTTSEFLVLNPTTGEIGRSEAKNTAGQIMRFGLNSGAFDTTERPMRFNSHNAAGEMGNSPNGNANFINTINGATFHEAQVMAAGTGTVARTTDRVFLLAGTYRVTLKISLTTPNALLISVLNNIYFKIIINNNEYSLQQASFQANGGLGNTTIYATGYTIEDYLDLSSDSYLDFSTQNTDGSSDYKFIDRVAIGSGNSYRSIIMIERIK